MRWPRVMRRGRRQGAPVGRVAGYTPGTWAQPAMPLENSVVMPPPEPAVTVISPNPPIDSVAPVMAPPLVGPPPGTPAPPPVPAVPTPPPVASDPVPMSMPVPPPIPPVAAGVAAAPAEEPEAAVRLGFADGSDLHLDPDDPHTKALKAVADMLTHRGPHRRRNVS